MGLLQEASIREAVPQRALNIGWCVSALSINVASVRYRALLPLLALEADHHRCTLFTSDTPVDLDSLDVLILVKTFTAESVMLAQACKARNIPVLLDLCDNIFVEGYGKRNALENFLEIARVASAMVVTTEPLAASVRDHLPGLPVHVIPDGLLTPELVEQGSVKIQRATPSSPTAAARQGQWLDHLRALLLRLKAPFSGRSNARHKSLANLPSHSGQAQPGALQLLWFGNHGAPYARFGMLDLLDIREALETIAQEFPVELVVVSSHQGKYAEHIAPMAIPSRYLPWSNEVVEQCLVEASVVLIPNSLDPFSLAKSANRSVHALTRGVPVVATRTPALVPLAGSIEMDGFVAGLRRYLNDREAGQQDVAQAQRLIDRNYGVEVIGALWCSVLHGVQHAVPHSDAARA
jgi:glycosyltransferase involved in cell wall biosynthesis